MAAATESIVLLANVVREACMTGTPMLHPDALRCAYIRTVVEHYGGNKSVAAKAMNLDRRSLQRMMLKNPDRRKGEVQPCKMVCHKCREAKC